MNEFQLRGRWEACGSDSDPTSRLRLPNGVAINGYSLHVEAVAVHYPNDLQTAVDPEFADMIDAVQSLADGCVTDMDIDGRTYVLVLTPYQS